MDCCQCDKKIEEKKKKGFLTGVFYGILPHTFCILFIVFTVLGATTLTAILKPIMLKSYFFYLLIALSFILATISAIVYLKRMGKLSFPGIKKKWKYLSILYGTTIFINLFLFLVIFPLAANLNQKPSIKDSSSLFLTLEVKIPCSGHAPLITDELKKISGVESVYFKLPNLFDVIYDPAKTTKEQILSLDVFNEYRAVIISEK